MTKWLSYKWLSTSELVDSLEKSAKFKDKILNIEEEKEDVMNIESKDEKKENNKE